MIRILKLVLLLVVSQVAFAQAPSNYTNINGRYRWIAGMFDSTFHIPKGSTPSLRTGGSTNAGALFYKTSDSTVRYWTGSNWLTIADTGRFVPYTGAIDTLNMGQFGVKTKFIQFDTSTRAVNDRVLQWSNDNGTLSFGMTNGGTIEQEIGLQQFARVKNVQGSQINKGQVVYLYGASGDRATVKLADNRADSTSSKTLGIAIENIPINGEGFVGTFGTMSGFNTTGYTAGDVLYLDSIPGGITKTKPQAPYHLVFVGVVEKVNAGAGLIFTNVQNGYELDELHDVRITKPVRNMGLLVYDSTRSLWVDTTLNAIGGVTGSGTTNYVSKFNGTNSLTNSQIFDNGTSVGINTNTPSASFKLDVSGNSRFQDELEVSRNIKNDNSISLGYGTGYIYNNYTTIVGQANGLYIWKGTSPNTANLNWPSLSSSRNYTFQDASGTLAFTSDITSALLNYVPNSRTITINGSTQNLSANRTWSVGTVTMVQTNDATGIKGGTFTEFGTIYADTLLLSTRKWRQKGIDSVAALVSGAVSGTTNYIPKFTSSSAIGNSDMVTNASGHLLFNSNDIVIGQNTSDGSDNRAIYLSGGANQTVGRGANLRVFGNEYSGDAGNAYLYSGNVANSSIVLNAYTSTSSIQFLANNSEQMRLTSTGLGIGTSSPAYKLDVNGDTRLGGIVGANGVPEAGWAIKSNGNSKVESNTGTTVLQVNETSTGGKAWSLISAGNGNVHSIPAGTFYLRNSSDGTTAFQVTSSGNLGLGVTPSAWYNSGGYNAFQVGNASLFGRNSANSELYLSANYYANSLGASTYITNDYATQYYQNDGQHVWLTAPSGTAGNAISFTQAMTLDASGRLGIGTTSPGDKLEVNGNVYATAFHAVGSIARFVAGGGVYISGLNGSSYGALQSYSDASGTGRILSLNPSGGNVGIGTTSPAALLHVSQASANTIFRLGNNTTYDQFIYFNGNNDWSLGMDYSNSNAFVLSNASSLGTNDRLVITTAGNVGIGTTSPNIVGVTGTVTTINTSTTNAYGGLELAYQGTSIASFLNNYNIGVILSSRTAIPLIFETGATERMRITSGGSVGIGTSSPSYTLDVNGQIRSQNSGTAEFRAVGGSYGGNYNTTLRSNSSAQGVLQLGNNAENYIIGGNTASGGFLVFKVNGTTESVATGTEAMRITNAGNIGIGTSTASYLLTVGTPGTTTDSYIQIGSSTTGTGNLFFGDATGTGTASYSGFIKYSHLADQMLFGTSSANAMSINSAGSVGVGTTSPDGSAIVHISSTTKGFLPPVMTGAQAEAISTPAAGLMVYANNGNGTTITTTGWWGYNGTTWVKLN